MRTACFVRAQACQRTRCVVFRGGHCVAGALVARICFAKKHKILSTALSSIQKSVTIVQCHSMAFIVYILTIRSRIPEQSQLPLLRKVKSRFRSFLLHRSLNDCTLSLSMLNIVC